MTNFLVVLRYPDYCADDYPNDTYTTNISAGSPADAVRWAQIEATTDQGENALVIGDPEDFAVVIVVSGKFHYYLPESIQ